MIFRPFAKTAATNRGDFSHFATEIFIETEELDMDCAPILGELFRRFWASRRKERRKKELEATFLREFDLRLERAN